MVVPFDLVGCPRPAHSAFKPAAALIPSAGVGAMRPNFQATGLAPTNSLRYDIAAQCRE
jgi:hypothetical protein